MKKILAISFSQTGQLDLLIDKFLEGFGSDFLIERVRYLPAVAYSFPWTSDSFFATMPHSVLGIPTPLCNISYAQSKYDLIVFGYQPWYLSPSIPATSILKDKKFCDMVSGTPVITLIGARNMWLNAQEKVKNLLQDANGSVVGNIVAVDRHNNYASAGSILYWMFTGKKERFLGILPKPGVSDSDILKQKHFGEIARECIINNMLPQLQQKLVEAKAVEVNTDYMFVENKAGRIFKIWASLIEGKARKRFWLKLFKYYLLVALFVVAPIVLLFYNFLIKPFMYRRILKKKNYYLGLN